jgi:hypothetical protein
MRLIILALCSFVCIFAQWEVCMKQCDVQYGHLPKQTFCSSVGATVSIPRDYPSSFCYTYGCNITALYAGTCTCPNLCYESLGNGRCTMTGCTCANGFTGRDCSMTNIPPPNLNLPPLPFGEIFPHPYVASDPYKDNHPILNSSVLTTIHVEIAESVLKEIIHPSYIWNADFVPVTFTFENGRIKETRERVGMRVKGNAGRMSRKKGWKFSFTKFGGPKFFGLSRISVKGQQETSAGVMSFIGMELVRSLGLPHQRGGFARLYINRIHYGIFWLHEEIEKEFFVARYPNVEGGMYKCGAAAANLSYIDNKQKSYRQLNVTGNGYFAHVYSKSGGTGKKDFSKFVDFVTVINKTKNFIRDIQLGFNVDRFLRSLVHEVMFMNCDCYSIWNNNFILYEDFASKRMEYIMHDFDLGFFGKNVTNSDVFKWGDVTCYPFPKYYAPLTKKIQETPEFRAIFARYLRLYIEKIYQPTKLFARWRVIRDSLFPFMKMDMMYRLDCLDGFMQCPRDQVVWYKRFDELEELVTARFRNVLTQLN